MFQQNNLIKTNKNYMLSFLKQNKNQLKKFRGWKIWYFPVRLKRISTIQIFLSRTNTFLMH